MPRLHFCEKLRNASEVNLACTNTYPNFREDLQIFEEEFPAMTQREFFKAGTTDANLLASTRLNAPMRRVSSPRVEAKTGANGKPLQIVFAASVLRSSPEINGHPRAMSPARITASGLNPFVRLAIPSPRQYAVSSSASFAA